MAIDLVKKIQKVNSESEKNNKKTLEARAKRKLLLEQISEKVSVIEERYGISFPNLDNTAEFETFLTELLSKEEEELNSKLELAEQVNELIELGEVEKAQKLLGYKPTKPSKTTKKDEVKDEEDVSSDIEETSTEPTDLEEELEDTESVVVEEKPLRRVVGAKPKKVVKKVVEDDLEDLSEEEEEVSPKPKRLKKSLETTNFDMDDLSLDSLDEIAGSFTKPKKVEEEDDDSLEGLTIAERIRMKRKNLAAKDNSLEEDDDEDSTPLVKTGGMRKW